MTHVRCEGTRVYSDVEISARDGRLVLRARKRLDESVRVPGDMYACWRAPGQVYLGRDLAPLFAGVPGAERCGICQTGGDVYKLLINGFWMQTFAAMVLGAEERLAFRQLQLAPVPAVAWLLGRTAAKEAVRLLSREQGSTQRVPPCSPLHMADVTIVGQPDCPPAARLGDGRTRRVSLAHKGFLAVAVSAAPEDFAGVGIDLEPIVPLKESVWAEAFSDEERGRIEAASVGAPADEACVAAWCAKEAAGKALGHGLAFGPTSLECLALDRGARRITLAARGKLAECWRSEIGDQRSEVRPPTSDLRHPTSGLQPPLLDVYWRRHAGHVVALCLLPAASADVPQATKGN